MKFIKGNISILLAALILALAIPARAQTLIGSQNVTATILNDAASVSPAVLSAISTGQLPSIVGTPFTVKGQTFLITTNATGGIQVYSYGQAGTNSIAVPANPQQAMATATAWIQANNPANIGYYGSNEFNVRVGAAYVQSTGQAVALIAVEKYGLFGWQNVGFGAGVLQGNSVGQPGTAGFYGEAVYRHPIGDVAVNGGVIAGYDNWGKKPFGGVKVGLEYRQSAHLGEFLDYDYAFEPNTSSKGGSLISAGVEYSF